MKSIHYIFLLVAIFFTTNRLVAQTVADSTYSEVGSAYQNNLRELLKSDSLKFMQMSDSTFILEVGDTLLVLKVFSKDLVRKVTPIAPEPVVVEEIKKEKLWKIKGSFALNFANVGLSNWAGGGNASISVGGIFSASAKRETKASIWEHAIRAAYGVTRVGGFGVEKSDDDLRISSQYSKKFDKNWSISFRSEFGSQFNDGFRIDRNTRERLDLISSILAPARLEVSSGIRFSSKFGKNNESQISNTLSPATGKLTYVLDERVDETDYGIEEGKNMLSEVGIQFYSSFETKPTKNLNLQNSLRLFANYQDIEKIDVNWETLFVFKINKFLNTNFSTNLIYDDDTEIEEKNDAGEVIAKGPKVQFKHVLNVGMNFLF